VGGLLKKYRAIIHKVDRDYHAFTGSKEISVNSWDEAEAYCLEHSWTGHDYYVYGLVDDKIRKGYFSKREFIDGIS
jgi:hypothetical protein